MEVRPGRYTADIEGDFVVFLIGMRFNHPLRVRKWLPVATAMPKMVKVLQPAPRTGLPGRPAVVRADDDYGSVLARLRLTGPVRPG